MNAPLTEEERLTARGYRRTSRSYGMVSRIDRSDWIDVLAERLLRTCDEMRKMIHEQPGQWEDFYRRVISKDTVTLDPPRRALKVPPSRSDPAGYVP